MTIKMMIKIYNNNNTTIIKALKTEIIIRMITIILTMRMINVGG